MKASAAVMALVACVGLAGCGGDDGGAGEGRTDEAAVRGTTSASDATPGDAGAVARNLVIISLDTLRADGLSWAGGPPNVSPTLEAFARESVVFTHARAPAPHTAPSHMSLFTSQYPTTHGVQNVAQKTDAETGAKRPVIVPLPAGMPTLAEVLAGRGFTTIGLTDGGNLNRAHGFPRGFHEYTVDLIGAEAQVREGLERLGALTAPDAPPFFLFWHTYQIHSPYAPPTPYASMYTPEEYDGFMRDVVEDLADLPFARKWGLMKSTYWARRDEFSWPESAYLHGLYKGEIRYTDTLLAGLFGALRERGVLDDSIVVVLSDHGEEFFEHGRWQHEQLYEECLRIPLLVRLPGGRGGGRRIDTPVSLVDVMPTVLDLLGQPREELSLAGRSLAGAIVDGERLDERPVVSELHWNRGENSPDSLVAIHYEGMKYVHDLQWEHHRLFDLRADPDERKNLAGTGHRAEDTLRGYFETFMIGARGGVEGVEVDELSPETLEQLEQLGYIGAQPDQR